MSEENINQEFILKNIGEIINYFTEERNQNQLMSKKNKKFCRAVNYIEHLLILVSAVTGCVSISAFASSVGIPIGITISSIWLKICAITSEIKKYKSIINKKKKKHNKIVLLEKFKLNSREILICNDLVDSNIGHDKFVLINDVLK